MRLALLALLLLTPAASVAAPDRPNAAPPGRAAGEMPIVDPNADAPTNCPPTSRYDAARRGGRLGAQKLNELPVADHYLAVYRKVGGCEVPVVAGYGIGTIQR